MHQDCGVVTSLRYRSRTLSHMAVRLIAQPLDNAKRVGRSHMRLPIACARLSMMSHGHPGCFWRHVVRKP